MLLTNATSVARSGVSCTFGGRRMTRHKFKARNGKIVRKISYRKSVAAKVY